MMGVDSWVQIELCNPRGECCLSSPIRDRQGTQWAPVESDDPCHGFALNTEPVDSQTYVIRHSGPDSIGMAEFKIFLGGGTIFICGADGGIRLSSETTREMALVCRSYFAFR